MYVFGYTVVTAGSWRHIIANFFICETFEWHKIKFMKVMRYKRSDRKLKEQLC